MKSFHGDDGSSTYLHDDGSCSIHTKDGGWMSLDLSSRKWNGLQVPSIPAPNSPAHKFSRKGFWGWVVYALFHIAYALLPILYVMALLLALSLPCALFEWLFDVRISSSLVAIGLTVAFWIVFFIVFCVIAFAIPWKQFRPKREWLLAPIRYLRKQFRQIEIETRP